MTYRILPLLFFVHFWMIGFGQTEKGNWIFKNNTDLKSQVGTAGFLLKIHPEIDYFIGKNFSFGSSFLADIDEVKEQPLNFRESDFGITPRLRYYLFKGQFRVYLQTEFALNWHTFKFLDDGGPSGVNTGKRKEFAKRAAGRIGLNLFLNPQVAIKTEFVYYVNQILESYNIGRRLRAFHFEIDYYFGNQSEKRAAAAPLVERFLKKRNFQFQWDGFLEFKTFSFIPISWDLFLTDRWKLSNRFDLFGQNDILSSSTRLLIGYNPEIQVYIPLRPTTFFTPSIGLYSQFFKENKAFEGKFSHLTLTLTQFLDNAIFTAGGEGRRHWGFRNRQWDMDMFVNVRIFLTPNISMNAELRTVVFGQPRFNFSTFNEPNTFEMLRFGFQYFMEKNSKD